MPASARVAAAVAAAHRHEWAFVLAATARVATDLQAAEEAVQDAYTSALQGWDERGIPERPGAWLTIAARNRALDLRRRADTAQRALSRLVADEGDAPLAADQGFLDDRLRLIFTCCQPALSPEARVALTLRMVAGLTTAEIARAFLVAEPTMAARITRAKKKITSARIPYRIPEQGQLPERLDAVLDVIHLVFSTGHAAPSGAGLVRPKLIERSLELSAMLHELLPDQSEVAGLLALILLTDARRPARIDETGAAVMLESQDRSRWDHGAIRSSAVALRAALAAGPPGRFTLMAAIAAVHDEAQSFEDTDWRQIADLYDLLYAIWATPVVALNRAIATGFADGFDVGLAELDLLRNDPHLVGYGYLEAARADFLARLGRTHAARLAYEEALLLTENDVERLLLSRKAESLPHF